MSKFIRTWSDLREHGIEYLTSESCALGRRLLCDVSERGRLLLCRALGLPSGTEFAPAWNSRVGPDREPAVGSILLSRYIGAEVTVLALFAAGYKYVVVAEKNYHFHEAAGVLTEAEAVEYRGVYERQGFDPVRVHAASSDRNVHQMSGRTT